MSLFGVAFAAASRSLVDRASGAAAGGAGGPLLIMVGLVLLLMAGQAGLAVLSPRLTLRMEQRLRARLYEGLQSAAWNDLRRRHSGDLLTRLTSDVGTVVNGVTGLIPEILSMSVRLLGALVYLAVMDATLAVAALAAGPLFLIPGRIFAGRLRDLDRRTRENEGRLRGFVQETLRKNEIVKSFELEPVFATRLADHHAEGMRLQTRRAWLSVAPGTGLTAGYWAGHLMALGWGAARMASGHATFGTLTAFLQLIGHVQGPLHVVARSVPRLATLLASAERLGDIERIEAEDRGDRGLTCAADVPGPGVDIEFRNVSFAYDGVHVLRNVNFRIAAGEKVALMGPSGAGKTTILRLLLGLVRPSEGEVLIRTGDGDTGPLSASRSTRRCFAHVPQGNTLFSGTLVDNVMLGRPSGDRTGAVSACREAEADGFARALPASYDTPVGENGDGLSEGQAQRVALARAIHRGAPVLLLDEATSALDRETEQVVLGRLGGRNGGRTLILVSHRGEVRSICDRVLRVAGGRVEEENVRENDSP